MLLGQERPTRGRILLDGAPLPTEPGPARSVVCQRHSVFPHLTVQRNVMLAPELQAHRLLGRSSGAARRDLQQRLALAQALMMQPRVLLLDEPFGALDPGIRADIHFLMKRLWHEVPMTVVMGTDDLREAFMLATRIIAFERLKNRPGELQRCGATIAKDIAIRPPRMAGQVTMFYAGILPDRDDPVNFEAHTGTTRQS